MARIKRSVELGSRSGRARLKQRPEPYWHAIETGLAIGYRRSSEGGAWLMRRYSAATRKHHERRIGTADDARDADGADVLDFGQAQRAVLATAKADAENVSGKHYTVRQAIADYVEHLRREGRTADDTNARLTAYLDSKLGDTMVSALTPKLLDDWLAYALRRPRRHRPRKVATTRPAKAAAALTAEQTREKQRRRRATINRVIAAFKATLNYAHSRGLAPNSAAWAKLQKFGKVDGARLRWLTVDEARRLTNAASARFRPLVRAALLTGCRAGELLAMRAGDFDPKSRTVLVAQSKSGKGRRVPLTDEGASFFASAVAGMREDSPIFTQDNGQAWNRMAVSREMLRACKDGRVAVATFHALRHTYASLLVQQGVPLMHVAAALGHTDTRMVEKHYGHLGPNAVADAIRANLPTFGEPTTSNVADLRVHKKS